jgi:hypothetical protein
VYFCTLNCIFVMLFRKTFLQQTDFKKMCLRLIALWVKINWQSSYFLEIFVLCSSKVFFQGRRYFWFSSPKIYSSFSSFWWISKWVAHVENINLNSFVVFESCWDFAQTYSSNKKYCGLNTAAVLRFSVSSDTFVIFLIEKQLPF